MWPWIRPRPRLTEVPWNSVSNGLPSPMALSQTFEDCSRAGRSAASPSSCGRACAPGSYSRSSHRRGLAYVKFLSRSARNMPIGLPSKTARNCASLSRRALSRDDNVLLRRVVSDCDDAVDLAHGRALLDHGLARHQGRRLLSDQLELPDELIGEYEGQQHRHGERRRAEPRQRLPTLLEWFFQLRERHHDRRGPTRQG